MKRSARLFLICLALVLTLCSCSGKSSYAIKIGDKTVTENDYFRTITTLRTNYLSSDPEAEDTKEFWSSKTDTGSTLSDTVVDVVKDHLIEAKLYSLQFDKLGLTFTESEESTIQSALSDTVESFGSLSTFNEYLTARNYTYDEYLEEVYDSAKKSKVLSYYYGADGKDPVPLDDIKEYYNYHNALVKIVYILKTDSETEKPLEGDDLKKAQARAEDAYAAATRPADGDSFSDVIAVYSAYPKDTDSVVINASNTDEKVLKDVMALKVGGVTKIETEDCFFIVKRYDATAEDVFTASMQQAVLEEVRAEQIAEMLAKWEAEEEIKINKRVIKKYSPEKLIND